MSERSIHRNKKNYGSHVLQTFNFVSGIKLNKFLLLLSSKNDFDFTYSMTIMDFQMVQMGLTQSFEWYLKYFKIYIKINYNSIIVYNLT